LATPKPNSSSSTRTASQSARVTPAVDTLQAGFSWNFETAIEQKDAVSATLVGFTGS